MMQSSDISASAADPDHQPQSEFRETSSTHSLPLISPHIAIEQSAGAPLRPNIAPHISAPPSAPNFQSPMRHHKRTPSQHREVKETLNARTEYTSDETDGRSQHTVNQYVIRQEIGRGSYGAVHLATDQFGQEFALKEFSKSRLRKRAQSNILKRPEVGRPRQLAPGRTHWNAHKKQLSNYEAAQAKDALYLIREEIAIMKKLNHPNLVSLIEVLDDPEEDSLYMVLEMCKKGVVMKVGLDDHADPYDPELCRTWFRDLILGIEYLHHQGIIHRDIKPDNLLLTEDDVLKIVDFGVSEIFEKPDQMMTHKSAGSPAFLPPELCQANHGDVSGKAADIWSMGVTLHCLRYGRLPFNSDSVLEMYEAIRTEKLQIPEDEDRGLADLLTRILDKDNATRITLRDLREHPWVTKDGSDPLLSEEENCSAEVEMPNELEVNHAFTLKMDHLLYVLRAIQRFKSLRPSSRVTTPRTLRSPELPELPEKMATLQTSTTTSSSQAPPEPNPSTRPRHKSIADEAADIIAQRQAFFASSQPRTRHTEPAIGTGDKGHAHDLTAERAPLFLGIGTGERDDFARAQTPADVVSDSPTGIDFDIYDRAFETEIKRIRSDRKKGGRAQTYLTRFVGDKEMDKYAGDDCMVVEAGKSVASSVYTHSSSAASRTLTHIYDAKGGTHEEGQMRERIDTKRQESHDGAKRVLEVAKEKGQKFADLVASMRPQPKEEKGRGQEEGHKEEQQR